jgi:hypothetical protein
MAYKNSIIVADQLPFVFAFSVRLVKFKISNNTNAPEVRRITVKLAASIVASPNASRHSTELAAKAMSANRVSVVVFSSEWIFYDPVIVL